ncbi:replicative DNA helicase [Lactococcus formosensis]|jgi:replicative DNA helicase|uniref:Replicative DNA helicase n=1 Tax=Lactococcus formosensis TaxID=1281486 RepID=A0A9Q8Y0R2_9LACT|nr:replicative DNA helicase [Lactococcus formosensis]NHI99596.1 replicative DNA helicase [Lactococcus garvieae]MCH1722271.1 replicative DNA helicase [Lactococcus formosensis]MDG6113996.1 replicative DNA helicase [Lactococcus formosensis]MDG6115977.1 replicative DNA helicase [Lactococcus formosensis]MDG6122013.1 replicative DNA helicase [Lactococcus formosensis]
MPDIDIIKAPPQDLAAEQAVLGAIFLDSDRLIEVKEFLSTDDFYKNAHKIIFRAMEHLSDNREAIDVLTVRSLLENQNDLEAIGGIAYIAELATATPTAANASYYAKIVAEKSLLRQLITKLTQSVEKAYSQEDPAEDVLAEAEKSLIDVQQGRNTSSFRRISDVLSMNLDDLEERAKQKSTITGIATGYPALDAMTTGLHEEELIILAARPAVGKTAFALNIAQNIGTKQDKTVAIFSLEMGAESLVNRMLAAEGTIESHNLRTGQLNDEEWNQYFIAMGTLSKASIYIDDTPGIKITEIRARSRKLAQETGNLGLIVIDYLQLISGTGRENRQQEVSEISRQLKILAKELKVPVIALSQLSRGVEQRQDKRPVLSDIRESGSIEQDADIVAFLYRDDYYDRAGADDDDDGFNEVPEVDNKVEVIIEKNRSGSRGTVELLFLKEYNKFASIDNRYED